MAADRSGEAEEASAPEKTAEEREKVGPGNPPKAFQFKAGNPGRPKGSRNKLGEAFIAALHDDFAEHGVGVIETVRTERPHEYLKVVASLLPKQVEIKEEAFDGVSDEELSALIVAARSALGVGEGSGNGTGEPEGQEPSEGLPAVH